MRSIALAAVLIAGCQVASPRVSRQCDARTAALSEKLGQVQPPTTAHEAPTMAGFEVPTVASASSVVSDEPALELIIDAHADAELNGRSIRDVESLVGDLRSLRARWALLHPGQQPPRVLNVWAHSRLQMHRVTPWLEPVRAAGVTVRFLARAESARDWRSECPASLGMMCSTLDPAVPSSQAQFAADALQTAAGHCRPLSQALTQLNGVSNQERARRIRENVPTALRTCDCGRGVDVDALEYLTVLLSGAAKPSVTAVDWTETELRERETVGAWIARNASR